MSAFAWSLCLARVIVSEGLAPVVPQHLCEVARFSILRQLERRFTVHFGIDLGSAIKEQSYESRISGHDGMVQGGAPTAAP